MEEHTCEAKLPHVNGKGGKKLGNIHTRKAVPYHEPTVMVHTRKAVTYHAPTVMVHTPKAVAYHEPTVL